MGQKLQILSPPSNLHAERESENTMKAKELYRALETELGPVLATHGFKKKRGSRLVFQRVVDSKYHSVWFMCDKHGWDSYAGGEFYANFTVSESPELGILGPHDESLNFFLTDAELAWARSYRDEVVERIPKPPESYFEALEAGFSKSISAESAAQLVETVRGYFQPEPIPYRRHQAFTLRYWQPGDITGWATLIASALPRALVVMQSWSQKKQ